MTPLHTEAQLFSGVCVLGGENQTLPAKTREGQEGRLFVLVTRAVITPEKGLGEPAHLDLSLLELQTSSFPSAL